MAEITEAKHTPGPWRPLYNDRFHDGHIRSDHHRHGTGALLLKTGPMFHNYSPDRDEERANIYLAASAPELLSALEKLMAAIEDATWEENYQALVAYKAKHGHVNVPVDYKSDSPGVCGQIPLAEAEAAIRKARGG